MEDKLNNKDKPAAEPRLVKLIEESNGKTKELGVKPAPLAAQPQTQPQSPKKP